MPISRAESLSDRYPFSTPPSISTVSCVGDPSSSTFSDPRRPAIVPLSTTVTLGLATGSPNQPRKRRSPLAIEVGLQPMPNSFMQQNPRPSRPQHHFHLARRRRHRAQLQNRASRRLPRQVLRALRSQRTAPVPPVRRRPPIPWSSSRRLWQSQTHSAGTAAAYRWQTRHPKPQSKSAAVPRCISPAPAQSADRTPAPPGQPARISSSRAARSRSNPPSGTG